MAVGMIAMQFFYMQKDFYAGQFTKRAIPKSFSLTQRIASYFISVLNKNQEIFKNVLVRDFKETFNNSKIQLPTKNGEIDFEFMESFIAELESERIADLHAYLTVTGLKDCTLTIAEQKTIENFEQGKLETIEWGEYRIEDVLQWQPQKEIDPLKLEKLKDEAEMIYPFYGQSTMNNGIISYHRLTNNILNNKNGKPTILIHSNNQNIVYLQTPFYLKDGHGATSVLQCEKLNKTNQMFIISSIDKVIKNKYSYNKKATKIELKNTVISLPTKNGVIDFEFMEILISAIQKLVIKDVVLYANNKKSSM